MQTPEIAETKEIVGDMLRSHLPSGWAFRVRLSPRADQGGAEGVTRNDLSWLIWRPEDIGNMQRYYRLELVGSSGHEFVVTHGNSDEGQGPQPELATVFSTWTADQAFAAIVRGVPPYGPNRYGRR